MSIIINILLLILVIGILTFVHELGHFLAAKIVGAKVSDFSIGYGPKLISKKIGETTYNIRILPLGGFVKILGDGDPTEEKEDGKDSGNLKNKPKLAQMFVMLAGVTMNILLAVIIYFIVISSNNWRIQLSSEYENFNPIGAQITKERVTNLPYAVIKDAYADNTDIYDKGYIAQINGQTIEYFENLSEILQENRNKEVEIYICESELENCKTFKIQVPEDGKLGIAIGYNYEIYIDYANNKISAGFAHTLNMLKLTGSVFSSMFKEAKETGDYSQLSTSVSGPIGIYLVIDYFKSFGLIIFLGLIADLSVSLAIINVLPIPALDGGRVGILIIESILRKDLDEKVENFLINMGFIFLIILIIVIMLKDIFTFQQLQEVFK